MNIDEPLMTALIKLYADHRRFFYLDNFQNFKLFASWLTDEPVGDTPIFDSSITPWYRSNYELNELAKILKYSPEKLYKELEKLYE